MKSEKSAESYYAAQRVVHAALHLQEMKKRGTPERIAEAEAAFKEALSPFEIPVDNESAE